jgi:hypothetical protein
MLIYLHASSCNLRSSCTLNFHVFRYKCKMDHIFPYSLYLSFFVFFFPYFFLFVYGEDKEKHRKLGQTRNKELCSYLKHDWYGTEACHICQNAWNGRVTNSHRNEGEYCNLEDRPPKVLFEKLHCSLVCRFCYRWCISIIVRRKQIPRAEITLDRTKIMFTFS